MSYSADLKNVWNTFNVGVLTVLALISVSCQLQTTGIQTSKTNVDETAVISALRTVVVAQQAHAVANDGNYATFPQLVEGGYLDSRFSGDAPEFKGFVLTLKVGEKSFSCNADPQAEKSGRHFYVDSSSPLIRVNSTQPATDKDGLLSL